MVHVNQLMHPRHVSGIRGLIFDCDGVMVDSLGANTWYYNRFKREFGLDPMTPDEKRFCHIHNVYKSLEHILPKEHWKKAAQFRATLDYREVLPHIRIEPGLRSFAAWLKRTGIRMAVNTSRTDTMDLVLGRFGLDKYFAPVVTTVKVAFPKPHPEGVHSILDCWQLPQSEVAYIGDSRVDEQTARAAGIAFWAFRNERLAADLHVPDFMSLQSAMMRAGNGRSGYGRPF